LECGLLRASFVPPKPIRELRDLTRYRKTLIRDRASEANRLHKVLEDASVKLSSVASNVLGVSGRLMLEALCQGRNDPVALAELARGRLRSKLPALRRALENRFRDHHAFLVAQIQLRRYPDNPFTRDEQVPLERTREMTAVLDRPQPRLAVRSSPPQQREMVASAGTRCALGKLPPMLVNDDDCVTALVRIDPDDQPTNHLLPARRGHSGTGRPAHPSRGRATLLSSHAGRSHAISRAAERSKATKATNGRANPRDRQQ
jgi:hypothetical protein